MNACGEERESGYSRSSHRYISIPGDHIQERRQEESKFIFLAGLLFLVFPIKLLLYHFQRDVRRGVIGKDSQLFSPASLSIEQRRQPSAPYFLQLTKKQTKEGQSNIHSQPFSYNKHPLFERPTVTCNFCCSESELISRNKRICA